MARPSAIVALQSSSIRADPSNPRDAKVLRKGKKGASISTLSNVAGGTADAMQREAMHLFGECVWHGNVAFAGLTRHSAKQCVYSVVCCVVVVVEFVVVVAFACDKCSVYVSGVVVI